MTLEEAAMKKDPGQANLDSVLVSKATPEYLQDLLKDKRQLQNFPNMFIHLEIILEKEINRVREKLFHLNESFRKTENELPEPSGVITTLQEKVFVPVKENPNYNFVGRLLGPRGLTAKQLEQDLECKIMVRGKGSLRDKKKEDMNRGKPNWEHLDEELHVLVSVEDYENRAAVKLRRATETIRNFLEQGVRTPENEDRLKQLQLMELAVLNDKDRQQAQAHQAQQQQQQQQQQQLLLQHQSLLSNPAAAAAAAAQLLHTSSSAQTTSQLLARLQASPIGISSLNAAALQLNPGIAAGITGSTAALQAAAAAAAAAAAGGSGAALPFSTMTSLASYLSSPGLTASPIQAASASNLGTATGGSAIGLPLSQLPCTTATGLGFSTLPFSVNPGLPTSGSTNLINCTPGSAQDQYTALAAALLSGGTNNTSNNNTAAAQMSNGKVPVSAGSSKPSTSYYPMTSLASSLVDPVTIIEYNSANSVAAAQEMASDSLKLRSISSGQNRMHPYLR